MDFQPLNLSNQELQNGKKLVDNGLVAACYTLDLADLQKRFSRWQSVTMLASSS